MPGHASRRRREAWFGIAGVGIISTFVAVQAFYGGAHRIGAARASLVSTVEPIWTIVLASLLMSLLYLGGESAQMNLALPSAVTGLFQGTLLFFLLAADVFVNYRVRIARSAPRPAT